jgi:N-methylhydantoinase A
LKKIWIGIDTGGTFTDLALCELTTGKYVYHKLPTTTGDPARAVLDGIAEILELAEVPRDQVKFLVLGTTLATNAVLEGKCARTGLITTEGFRDILELARQRRPHYYNLDVLKPTPPALRDCRIEVDGRIDHDGSEVTPLAEDQVRDAVARLRDKGVEAVAICMMHSYANPAHESRARDLVAEMWPEAYLCTSSDVLPEFREFERFSTTAINASLMPIMDRYLERFERGVADLGVEVAPRVMQSNGGAVTPGAVRRAPINTFFSGPAGGVVGCVGLGEHIGIENQITFDMGGTSTDVCLIREGEPAKKNLREMAGFPVRTRTIDLHTIGAGGGSIAWVDAGGLLKVGPQSAGAYPGPAAYGRGGTKPTVTDANVVLGRLNPKALLGGRMPMHPELARKAIEDELVPRLKVDVVEAAAGVIEIINVNMMGAVRVISVEQGEDPRDFTLVAFGGAGPLHAADVARSMGIRNVLVPPRPGILSAVGLLHADVRGDFSITRLVIAAPKNTGAINEGFEELRKRGREWLRGEASKGARAKYGWLIDMRYSGQNFELSLELKDGKLDAKSLAKLLERFHERHLAFYGYEMREQPVEAVNLRLAVSIERRTPTHEKVKAVRGTAKDAVIEKRQVWFPETGFVATPVYDRDRLPANCRITGPAIVEQMDTTTVVPPRAVLRNDRHGYLHLEVEPLAVKAPVKRAAGKREARVDPILAEVMARYLIATAEEMNATLVRTAFSPNIKERGDCSTAIFDGQGQVTALAHRIPMHLGSMVGAVDEIRKRFREDEIRPGDVFMANDPYNGGGTHLPDITLISPVFVDGRIVAFVANIAHHADVGGMVPGSEAAICTSIFQEGIRIPPVHLVSAGTINRDVLDLVLLNSRTPEERIGDFNAQMAANPVGVRGVQSLYKRYGTRVTDATIASYLDFTERRFAAAVKRMPPGIYEAEDYVDGATEGSVAKVGLELKVGKGSLEFDFRGSDPQIASARNLPYRALLATIYTLAKNLIDPDVPANAGYYRAIKVVTTPGTVVDASPPAAIGARVFTSAVAGDVIAEALTQAVPNKALAGSGPHHLVLLSGTDPRNGKYFVNYETVAGGMGARAYSDGMDGVRVHASGASNLPIEALEHAFPLRVERYALWPGSGGAGKFRGGMGVVRDYRMLTDDAVISLSSERQHNPARGMAGGDAGERGAFIKDPGTPNEQKLPSASGEIRMPRGSVLRICTPGGGGYGDPAERNPAARECDTREERVGPK